MNDGEAEILFFRNRTKFLPIFVTIHLVLQL